MPNVTEILGDESGIQYQGVEDRSSTTGSYPVVGLMVGKFKRGRFDKPMTITKSNIRAMLGYDPENPAYVAVADTLDAGVPSVQCLRLNVGGGLLPFPEIPDEDISDTIQYKGWFGLYWMSDVEWHLEVNGVLYKQTTPTGFEQGLGYYNTMDGSLYQIIADHELPFSTHESSEGSGYISASEVGEYKLRIIPQSLTTARPDDWPTPKLDVGGAIPVIDPATKIWSLILRKTES